MALQDVNQISTDEKKHEDSLSEDIKTGEQSISGSEADLESDDNVLDAANKAGIYENQDEEHPGEIDIAKEVEKDEKEHQRND